MIREKIHKWLHSCWETLFFDTQTQAETQAKTEAKD